MDNLPGSTLLVIIILFTLSRIGTVLLRYCETIRFDILRGPILPQVVAYISVLKVNPAARGAKFRRFS